MKIIILVIYALGFAAMYFFSLRRDEECGLERNPREAFWFALFWPVLVAFLAISILIEKVKFFIRCI